MVWARRQVGRLTETVKYITPVHSVLLAWLVTSIRRADICAAHFLSTLLCPHASGHVCRCPTRCASGRRSKSDPPVPRGPVRTRVLVDLFGRDIS